MVAHRKPVGILTWAGKHAQMAVGYYGLSGDPFAADKAGKVHECLHGRAVLPCRSASIAGPRQHPRLVRNAQVEQHPKLRFRPYLEKDSPYDEWYGKFVIIAPIR